MDLRNLKLEDLDLRKMGMLNAFAMTSVLVAVCGLVFGFVLSFAARTTSPYNSTTRAAQVSKQTTSVVSGVPNEQASRATVETEEDLGELKSIPTDTDLLGEWYLNRRSIGGHIRIYEGAKSERCLVDWTYRDGRRELRMAKRIKDKIMSGSGGYYLINADGDLEHRSAESKLIWTAKK